MKFIVYCLFSFFLVFKGWAIIDFKSSMIFTKKGLFLTSKKLQLYKQIYDQNNYENVELSSTPKIPKIIHQIWVGSPVPDKYKEMMASWQKMHPDWKYMLWTDEEIEDFPFLSREAFDAAKNYGMKSDIWRLDILYLYGGLYIDTDFECLQPFDIFHHAHDFYLSLLGDTIPNGLIGCAPKHPIMETCINKLKEADITELSDPMYVTGPYFLTDIVDEYLKTTTEGICIYPTSYFYPFPAYARFDYWKGKIAPEKVRSFFRNESFAVHYFATSWQY